jgi:hypothetical protein
MSLHDLSTVPEGVRHAAEVVAGLDRCFQTGFGRLGPQENQALQALGRVCADTPLAAPVADSLAALARNEFVDRFFAALAAARAAVQGAQYDALRAHAAAALGRPAATDADLDHAPPVGETSGPVGVWQESTRHWLMELAVAGFRQLEYQTLAPFSSTLEHLQGEPSTVRLAALLTGFLNELLGALPTAALPELPVYRWADLWTRAMVGSLRAPVAPAGRKVGGALTPLGVDLRQHGYFVSFDAYALLETGDETRVVRVTQSAYKVDVVFGAEVWQCFPKEAEPLLRAIGQQTRLKVEDMTLLPTGDLLWDGKASAGKPFDILDVAAGWLAPGTKQAPQWPVVAALDRHPVQLAEPVYLTGYTVHEGEAPRIELDGAALPMAVSRMAGASELQAEHVAKSSALVGLLRFDGGHWSVQPLAVATAGKKGPEYTGSRMAEHLVKKKGATLATLRERASRLLRQKA